MARIYIAGPYSSDSTFGQQANIDAARGAAIALYRMGHTPFCPHTMTAWFDRLAPDIPGEVYLRTGIEWLRLCEAVLMLPGWEQSAGSRAEYAEARERGLWVYVSIEEIPLEVAADGMEALVGDTEEAG